MFISEDLKRGEWVLKPGKMAKAIKITLYYIPDLQTQYEQSKNTKKLNLQDAKKQLPNRKSYGIMKAEYPKPPKKYCAATVRRNGDPYGKDHRPRLA